MNSFMNTYFGPLPREYCVYFYFLSIIFGFMFVFGAVLTVYFMVTKFKKVNLMFVSNALLVLANTFLAYISNRLLHTMCVRSI